MRLHASDVDLSGAAICRQVSADKEVFSVPLRPAKRTLPNTRTVITML